MLKRKIFQLQLLLWVFAAATAAAGEQPAGAMSIENYFSTLQRPASPNHWLVAPAGFPGKPDATAPVFAVPVTVLREAFKTVVAQSPGAVVAEETATGMHVIVTTRVFEFRDDVRARFIELGPQQSTLALYSASRVGYWDLGTNRRRIEDWLARTAAALASRHP